MSRFVTLQGVVKFVGDKSIFFREEGADHDICLPLSQLAEPHRIETGDENVEASAWILQRLDDEGKR